MANKVSRLWFVIPNDIKGDGRLWNGPDVVTRGAWGTIQAELAPAPARAQRPVRDRARGNDLIVEEAPVEEEQGVGLYLGPKETKEIMAFTTKAKATEYAKYQATMNPQKLYGIFACEQVFETTTPTVLEKKFNDAGELVLAGGTQS